MIKVLIVEDDPMVAEFNRRYLEQVPGFSPAGIASSGDEALKMLKSMEIDLILLDIYMPGMNGLSLLSKIRKLGKSVDVIIISAATDIASIKQALRLGTQDYLIKPFEFERFRDALCDYKEGIAMMRNQNNLNQTELDNLFFHKEKAAKSQLAELPKGLTRNTLRMVWEKIEERGAEPFTTEELTLSVPISRVSMRKYLNFLIGAGLLDMDIHYGSIGRPVCLHRIVPLNKDKIKLYV